MSKFKVGDRVAISKFSNEIMPEIQGKKGTVINVDESLYCIEVKYDNDFEDNCGWRAVWCKPCHLIKLRKKHPEYKVGDRIVFNNLCGKEIRGIKGTIVSINSFMGFCSHPFEVNFDNGFTADGRSWVLARKEHIKKLRKKPLELKAGMRVKSKLTGFKYTVGKDKNGDICFEDCCGEIFYAPKDYLSNLLNNFVKLKPKKTSAEVKSCVTGNYVSMKKNGFRYIKKQDEPKSKNTFKVGDIVDYIRYPGHTVAKVLKIDKEFVYHSNWSHKDNYDNHISLDRRAHYAKLKLIRRPPSCPCTHCKE